MARRRFREYPRVVYGPHGASMVITRLEDWPSGWTTQPEGTETVAPRAHPLVPYPRAELKRRLRDAGVSFLESSSDAHLWEVLQRHG